MSGLRIALACAAAALLAARLLTGIVYEYEDPTTYLVLKRSPGLAIEQDNTAADPVRSRFVVLDADENELAYQAIYIALMRAAPVAAAACVAFAILPSAGFTRRRSRPG